MTRNGGRPNIGGFRHLSPRQDQVARLVAAGKTNGEICGEIGMQPANLQQVLQAIRLKASLPPRRTLPLLQWCRMYVEQNPADEPTDATAQ